MWRGAISFGLVNVAVRLYAATEDHDYHFFQLHRKDHGRIRYKRVCTVCGEEVTFDEIAKGYEMDDGRLVVLEPEDFARLPITTERAIQVLEFVPVESVDPIYFQRSYLLEPENPSVRPYVLLRDALERVGRLAVVKITLRQRETLAMLRARDDVIVLHTMLWPDEIRPAEFEFLGQEVSVRPQELDMATSLIENMTGEFDPTEFSDDYQRLLGDLIEARAQGVEVPTGPPEEPAGGDVIDLMTALERSIAQTKTGDEPAAEKKPARRRTTAPKQPAGGGRTTAKAESGGRSKTGSAKSKSASGARADSADTESKTAQGDKARSPRRKTTGRKRTA
ncbi:Ku protein [Actinoalloteichus sp. GBA129-24]|uniref:Non-homologous end joining protein Ku n=2 Tax=Pseudonocardiaceae TaxID=2070 RepID=A0AAC9PUL0_9PSEU|nr:Ku protein [Actinoalloteichus fjordicus]APU23310.1 Ku protein [Actinoalloteichus sp. GBA129-24]